VSSAFIFARMVRVLGLAIPCLTPLLLSSCDFGLEAYPTSLTYPARSDPIVSEPPGSTTWDTIGPGQLEKHLAHLKEVEGKTLDPRDLSAKDKQGIASALQKFFGTPAKPTVKITKKDSRRDAPKVIADLHLDETTLENGSRVYRRHCMHCHGVSGDGRGPTGPWVNPSPRDYRQGIFKFISTAPRLGNRRKPRREDLHRTLDRGIEGTSMPSFGLLEEHEKEEVISYIIHLSVRGETEMSTMSPLLQKAELEGSIAESMEDTATDTLQLWADSEKSGLEPDAYPYGDSKEEREASIQRGYEVFTNPSGAASCIVCHTDFGRQAPFRYDVWGTLVRPANLTAGVYRGGRRPIDLYWRIRGGIPPSAMPNATLEVDKGKKTDQYWDLVNFVQALPYPSMLPEKVRKEIYGSRREQQTEHVQR
jgi:mono/diheme cytochrome c family protein